jgi:hypothetical protein
MKTILRVLVFPAVALLAAAQNPPPPSPRPSLPPSSANADELAALERFLTLSDEELAQMADAIARVRAMTPPQRAALREQILSYRRLPEPQRMKMRQGWGWMPPEIQHGWREMMQNATPEQRTAIHTAMQSLPPDEKMRYRRKVVEDYLKAQAEKK